VIYMPGHNYVDLAGKLQAAGLASDTPALIISRASTPDQQTSRTSIGELASSRRLPAPSLLIIGDVVRLAAIEQLIPGSCNADIAIPAELISAFATDSISEDPVA
jgi:siroheme synthase